MPISRNIMLSFVRKVEPVTIRLRLTLPDDMDKAKFDAVLDEAEEKANQYKDADWLSYVLKHAGIRVERHAPTPYVESVEDIDYEEIIEGKERKGERKMLDLDDMKRILRKSYEACITYEEVTDDAP